MRTIDRSRTAHWATDLIDVAAVFFAVGTAHLFVTLLGEHAHGAAMLTVSGAILIAGALLRKRWARRRRATVPRRHATLPDLLAIPARECTLMRLRTTLPDRPGTLAALSGRLAAQGVNILAIQIHPAEHGAVDELLVAVPREVSTDDLLAAVAAGGGELTEAIPADAHDLVDPATRALTIARHAAAGHTTLDEAVHRLLDADVTTTPPPAGAHVAAVHAASGEPYFLARRRPAFTPTEVSRAQSLIDLCEALSRR
ncbi:ACT domain-containing protein [Actinoplanes sp. NPDC051513]|uniref:ACT domain-containing protein n=1 Tax=Actinoplanes sp. NPDC051513 TaxID=3363908 RepID=UPI00378B44B7